MRFSLVPSLVPYQKEMGNKLFFIHWLGNKCCLGAAIQIYGFTKVLCLNLPGDGILTYLNYEEELRKIYLATSVISVQFSRSVVSDSFWPHELQHTRPPCPSPTSGVHPDSCPLSRWCHPAILSSVIPFSSCPDHQGHFQILHIRWPKYWSFRFSISPFNEYSGFISFRSDSWISLQSKGLSRVFSNTKVKSISSSMLSFLYSPTLTSIPGKTYRETHSFD